MSGAPTLSQVLSQAARAAGLQTGRGGDSRYFTTTKKGEIHELREELVSTKPAVKRDASAWARAARRGAGRSD